MVDDGIAAWGSDGDDEVPRAQCHGCVICCKPRFVECWSAAWLGKLLCFLFFYNGLQQPFVIICKMFTLKVNSSRLSLIQPLK